MQIRSIEIHGVADLPYCSLKDIPSQGMRFKRATPETTALADSIEMWFAAFDELALVDLIVEWGWAQEEDIEVFVKDRVEEVHWFDGSCSALWVEERDVRITLEVVLDAPTLQKLRHLISDPEVQVALMSEPTFTATVSLHWSSDHQVMGVGLSSIQLGQWQMPVEKPHWFGSLMQVFQSRFFRNHNRFNVAETALQTMLSLNGFKRYSEFQESCSEWGEIRVASILDREPVMLIDDKPIRRWGADMEMHIRVLAAWYLVQANIIWSDQFLSNIPTGRQVWGIDPSCQDPLDGEALNLSDKETTIHFPSL